jgi:hypothetical protein
MLLQSFDGIVRKKLVSIEPLIPIHKPITRLSPFNHPLGHVPAFASLGGHIVYGVVLGFMIFAFMLNYT